MSVRVRFAPSPTGYLHIGNARAALINWLFAKKNNGLFILRQDDTDLKRSEQRYADAIIEDLKWLGLEHAVFFKQSDRFDRYHEVVRTLTESGRLYPCYETPEELDYKRKMLLSQKKPPVYDRAGLRLTQEQIREYEAAGRKPHWRFKLNPGKIEWEDLIRGAVSFDTADISDPVLIRADGSFLYTITSVIDDFDYKITHIVRGEDHVTNTATQVQLLEAINNDKPFSIQFAHTTLLMDADGQPLSKRIGSLSLRGLRANGINPMAINAHLARLGTSLPVEPQLKLQDLVEKFDFKYFSRTAPKFNEDDLKLLNHKLFHMMPYEQVKPYIEKLECLKIKEAEWGVLHDNIESLDDLKRWETILYGTLTPSKSNDAAYIKLCFDVLPQGTITESTWAEWTKKIKELSGKKGKELFMPLRQALTGMDHGPEMKKLIVLMGYHQVCTRLKTQFTI
ncbi:MAG: glutamate--tRNA ligase [Alphaproteobacteria bacterium CG_4_10_14_0_8_um_filter_37_21]|nr:MAG: glutamate--tRNA ligase [Alphaproteobacteria bacterium CG_4_10_14_0_8_um_filter_37_21]